jgi:hypothetical protein
VSGGDGNLASGPYSMVPGGYYNTASGNYSSASNFHTTASSFAQTTLGAYNALKGGESTNSWVTTDPLFVVGNGTNASTLSTALMILKNGNVGIGTTAPSEKLEVSGNIKATGRIIASVGTDSDALSSLTVSFASANMIRATGASGACGTLNFTDVAAGGSYTVTIPNATATCTAVQLNGSSTDVKLPSGYTGGDAASGVVYTAIYDGTTLWVSYVPF